MLPAHLLPFAETPIPVLNDGHVMLVNVMGDDQFIVNAARVSYGKGTKRVSEDRHLIRYLMRNRHTSPFEMCEIVFRVRVPMDCWRQWVRHRTASINEYSTRYSAAIDSCQVTLPGEWRVQSGANKQGSDGFLTEWPAGTTAEHLISGAPKDLLTPIELAAAFARRGPLPEGEEKKGPESLGEWLSHHEKTLQDYARWVYEKRLQFGVAREVARKDLPLSTYTEAYWKCDLHNLLHFLTLRMDSHAQKEIRDFANAVATIVKAWVPWVWEAFEDYRLHSMYLTRFEKKAVKVLLRRLLSNGFLPEKLIEAALRESGLGEKGREVEELKAKLALLLAAD